MLEEFCCTAVKGGSLLLRIRRGGVAGASYDQNDVWDETY